jgi:hypothetical protein
MRAKLTSNYIEDHLSGVHTVESWARAVTETVLKQAATQIGTGEVDETVVNAQFRVSAYRLQTELPPTGGSVAPVPFEKYCIRVCIEHGHTSHCVHWEVVI